jgi:hypothetical protein
MQVMSKPIQFHHISRSEFMEFQQQMQQALRSIEDVIIRLTGKPYVDRIIEDDASCIRLFRNRIYESLNRHPVYEDNINYNKKDVKAIKLVEKVELLSEKQYVQPQSLVSTTAPVEEHPPQVHLIMITTEIKNNGESFEENNEVGKGIQKEIVGEIFMERDEKKKSCLSAIYIDFSKTLSLEEPRVTCYKENSMKSFFKVGVSDIGWNLHIFW